MQPLTIRLQANTKESLEDEAADANMSLSEYVRELISKGREYDDTVAELEARIDTDADEDALVDLRDRVDELEAQRDRLRTERNEAREEISRLNGRLEEIEARIDEKDDRIEHLEGQLQVKDGRLDELEKRTAAANKKAELQPADNVPDTGYLDRLRRLFGGGD